ncbi:hypothetical protein BH24ACT19_BH24ACT19_12250 [soil metagenome]
MNQRNQNRYVGITFVFVGLTLALAGGSMPDDAVTGTMIYVGAAVAVFLGLFMAVRGDRR